LRRIAMRRRPMSDWWVYTIVGAGIAVVMWIFDT
jgi:hypothetical protein